MPARSRPLMDIGQLADYLGVSVRHIRRLVAEQRIPYIKWGTHGSKLRFDPDDIDAWIDTWRRPARGAS